MQGELFLFWPESERRDLLPVLWKKSLVDTAQTPSVFIAVKFAQAFERATSQTPDRYCQTNQQR
jgi:hypothetical protein